MRWYGLDLNIAAVARAARSSRFREAERNKPPTHFLVEQTGYAIDKVTRGSLKRTFWAGCDNISAPLLTAAAGLAHVSIHPYKVWQAWLRDAGLQVVRKVRGPMLFGGPFFDRHPFISGVLIALDPILDRLPLRFLLSSNLGMLCCKR